MCANNHRFHAARVNLSRFSMPFEWISSPHWPLMRPFLPSITRRPLSSPRTQPKTPITGTAYSMGQRSGSLGVSSWLSRGVVKASQCSPPNIPYNSPKFCNPVLSTASTLDPTLYVALRPDNLFSSTRFLSGLPLGDHLPIRLQCR